MSKYQCQCKYFKNSQCHCQNFKANVKCQNFKTSTVKCQKVVCHDPISIKGVDRLLRELELSRFLATENLLIPIVVSIL